MWWMLAGVALQAVGQIGAAKGQAAVDKANNAATRAYNKQVALQAAQSFNEINLQKAALAQQVTQALASTQREGLQMSAARGAQAAASDTMGASVEQGLLDVSQKVDDAKSTLLYNENISDASLNAQAAAVGYSAASQVRAETPVTNVWGAALGKAAAGIGMSMLGNMNSPSSLFNTVGTGSTRAGYTSDAFKNFTSRNSGI